MKCCVNKYDAMQHMSKIVTYMCVSVQKHDYLALHDEALS